MVSRDSWLVAADGLSDLGAGRRSLRCDGNRGGDGSGPDLLHPAVSPWKLDVACQPGGAQSQDHIPVGIDLPPAQAMTRGVGMGMVIVVPALAEGEQRDEEIIGGVVAGRPAPRAPQEGSGVHDPGGGQPDAGWQEQPPANK